MQLARAEVTADGIEEALPTIEKVPLRTVPFPHRRARHNYRELSGCQLLAQMVPAIVAACRSAIMCQSQDLPCCTQAVHVRENRQQR
jgi:hypothetical protein